MPVNFEHYAGREPAFVKHTFLDKYLPALIARVGSRYDTFVYIDGFAGPWKSVAGETFADTSFGIALRHMTALRAVRARPVRMRAFLVEKDPATFADLETAVKAYGEVDVTPLRGEFEDHVPAILDAMPRDAFSFALIDPKGFPDMGRIMPLLARPNSEALVNFMFDFANRFAGTTLIPALERWLASAGDVEWRADVDSLTGRTREDRLEELAVAKLRREAGYKYAPVISVDKPLHDRTLYKLIFLTRHSAGLKVFRDSEDVALEAQATARAKVKSEARAVRAGMSDLFANGVDTIPHDRSSLRLRDGQAQARRMLVELLEASGPAGRRWADLWPDVLNSAVVTHSKLGRLANDLRKGSFIEAPGWPNERRQIPEDDQLLRLGDRSPQRG